MWTYKEELKKLKLKSYFISYPKSGRTWMRILYGFYLVKLLGLEDKIDNTSVIDMSRFFYIKNLQISDNQKKNLIECWTHDEPNFLLSFDIIKNPTDYTNSKIIFMRRNIKDLLVSHYYHGKYRSKINGKLLSNITIDEYVSHPLFGAEWIINYYIKLETALQNVPKDNVLVVDYENCISQISIEFKRILNFLNIPINETILSESIEFSCFKNLQKLEKENYFNISEQIGTSTPEEINSFKVRKGQVGGYKNELSENSISYVNNLVAEAACKFIIC